MKMDFSKMLEADVIVDRVLERYKKGLNSTIFIIGLSGTGKSSTSIRLGELISEKFEGESKITIVNSLLEFIKSVRDAREDVLSIDVEEEVSVLFPSRRAMAGDNVSVGKILDTIRKKKMIIIANAPIWNSFDSHMRAMGHFIIETLRINKTQGVVISKFHRLQTNPLSGKTYRHTLERNGKDISRMITRMPSKERWDNYETQKDKFMNELYLKLENEQHTKEKKLNKNRDVPEPEGLNEQEKKVYGFIYVKGLPQTEIAKILNVNEKRVSAIKKNILKKANSVENATEPPIK